MADRTGCSGDGVYKSLCSSPPSRFTFSKERLCSHPSSASNDDIVLIAVYTVINIDHRNLAIIVAAIRLTMTTAKDILWSIITVT